MNVECLIEQETNMHIVFARETWLMQNDKILETQNILKFGILYRKLSHNISI